MTDLRGVCIRLAELTHTPIPFWLGLSLPELREWVDEAVSLQYERNEALKNIRNGR